jgi:hypothetical protein
MFNSDPTFSMMMVCISYHEGQVSEEVNKRRETYVGGFEQTVPLMLQAMKACYGYDPVWDVVPDEESFEDVGGA